MAFGLNTFTDIFTGAPQQDAAQKQRDYIAQQNAAIAAQTQAAKDQGIAALNAGQTGALGAITGGVTTGRGDILGATPLATGALYGGQTLGEGALTSGQTGGLAALQSGVTSAVGAYDPLKAAAAGYGTLGGGAGSSIYDALGLGGTEGNARANAAFIASPGYNFQLGQGIDALTRAANLTGMGASGNTLRAAQDYGSGLASTEFYKNYLPAVQSLAGLYSPLQATALNQAAAGTASPYLTGGTGAANIYTGVGGKLSDLYSATGTTGSGIYANQGVNLADLASKGGLAQSGVYTGTGSNISNLISGLTGQQTSFEQAGLAPAVKSYADAAAAQTGGSANLWGLGLQAAKGAAGLGWLDFLKPSGGAPATTGGFGIG